jgi:hypothetical protein
MDMNASKTLLSVGAAALALVSGSQTAGLGAARVNPSAPHAVSTAPIDNVVIVQAGQGVDAALQAHAFVVVRRSDGSVPRAYLWDEPLGCPEARTQ